MDKRVLQQIGNKDRRQRFIHANLTSSRFFYRHMDMLIIEYLLEIFQVFMHERIDLYPRTFRKLSVFNLRNQQQRLIQFRDMLECLVDFAQFFQLTFRHRVIVHQHFNPILADRQRSLYFMRSISYKLFLLFINSFVMGSTANQSLIQFTKLGYIGRIPQRISIQPVQEFV